MPVLIILLAARFGSLDIHFPWWIWLLVGINLTCRWTWKAQVRDLLG